MQVALFLYAFIIEIVFSYAFQHRAASSKRHFLGKSTSLQMSRPRLFENFDALFFDCDGVIAETERDVHRITFNKAFSSMGLPNEWSIEEYGELLRIGGGKVMILLTYVEIIE